MLLPSVVMGQEPEEVAGPPASPQPVSQAKRPPALPADVAKELAREEELIADALAHPENLEGITNAIPKAEHAWQVRRERQGEAWWETVDARWRLADLQRLVTLPAEQRAKLTEAESLSSQGLQSHGEGQYARALELADKERELRGEVLGKEHPAYANCLSKAAFCLRALGRIAEALANYEAALMMRQRLFRGEHPAVLNSLDGLAFCLEFVGRNSEALPKLEAALAMRQRLLPGDHPEVADRLNNVAFCLGVLGRWGDALAKHEAALAMQQCLFTGDHPDVARSLSQVAYCLRMSGRSAQALTKYEKALAMQQRLSERDGSDVATSLEDMAGCLISLGRSAEALSKLEAALAMNQCMFRGDHPEVAKSLDSFGNCLASLVRLEEALPKFEAALAMKERLCKKDDLDLVLGLNSVASCLIFLGRAAEALPKCQAALAMVQRLFAGDNMFVALSLNTMGMCLKSLGRPAEALPKCEAALAMYQRLKMGVDSGAATSLGTIAGCLDSLGRPAEALAKYEEALAIQQRLFKGDELHVVMGLNGVASRLIDWGRGAEALPKCEAALAMAQRLFTEDHFVVALSLNTLGSCLDSLGRSAEALPKCEAALAMCQRLRVDNLVILPSLTSVASCLESLGRRAEALPKYEAALAILRRTFGEDSLEAAAGMWNVATTLGAIGRRVEAARLALKLAPLQWRYLTRSFPLLSAEQREQFQTRGGLHTSQMLLESLVFQGDVMEKDMGLRGVLLSKQLLFEAARQESRALLAAASEASAEWQRQWAQREQLRRQYATLALQGLLEAGRPQPPGQRSTLDPAHVRALAERIEALEKQLRQGNPAYALAARLQEVSLEDVTAALQPGEALVEYVRYHPYDFSWQLTNHWGAARYGAFILHVAGGNVAAVDLGAAAEIDAAVQQFRSKVREFVEQWGLNQKSVTPSAPQLREQLRENRDHPGVLSETRTALASVALRKSVWQPLEQHLVGINRVYVAPDGMLSLVPLEALAKQDETNRWRYLAEEREIVYLGTGRDLARLAMSATTAGTSSNTAVLIGNPAFSASPQELAAVVAGLEPAPMLVAQMGQSPAASTLGATTLGETKRLQVPRGWQQVEALDRLVAQARGQLEQLGWSVRTFTHQRAVKEAVLAVERPRLLQFATHGYILDRPNTDPEGWDNPLLRSMVLLAGVNTWHSSNAVFHRVGPELLTAEQARSKELSAEELTRNRVEVGNGILTAYEVTGMNLQGTELVNLTACETGLGEVTSDGVAGLRSAFLMAGARSLTMSMWEVPAVETTEQIADFYERWLGGSAGTKAATRYEAFRAAQLGALAQARQRYGAGHPFYWAGVVYVGDPGDLPQVNP
jgi:tetratricopeptide (TPR) repeat protein